MLFIILMVSVASSLKLEENDPELKKLCVCAFDTLSAALDNPKFNKDSISFPEKFKGQEFPLFVTWSTGPDRDLRGCIGTFASDSLEKNLKNYALTAAFDDSRFSPIRKKELPTLNVGVSLLINFEDGKDCYDWEVGKHGIRIKFDYYGATFLPQVASEQGWDKKTTLQHLIRKAGYGGELAKVEKKINLIRYQSLKVYMSYAEYIKYKKGNSDL